MNHSALIPATIEHFEDYFAIRSESSNVYWLGYNSAPERESFLKWYKERLQDQRRSIFLIKEGDEIAGSLHIDIIKNEFAIGYSIKEKFRGKGIAKKIVQSGIDYIKQLDLSKLSVHTKIIAWISEKNLASQRVVEFCGFEKSPVSEIRMRHGNQERYHKFVYNI